MAKIVISDLNQDETLDRQARLSITGGSRSPLLRNAPSAAAQSGEESKFVPGLRKTADLRQLLR